MAESWPKHATETGDKLRVLRSSNTHKKKKLPVIPVHFHTVSSILWFAADTLQEALQDPECPAPTRGQ